MPCVKWQLFKILDEEKFVFTELNPYINEVNGIKEELEKLLNFEHSACFFSPHDNMPTNSVNCCIVHVHLVVLCLYCLIQLGIYNLDPQIFSIRLNSEEYVRKLDIVLGQCKGIVGVLVFILTAKIKACWYN